jgi:pilus assembly protein CpaB
MGHKASDPKGEPSNARTATLEVNPIDAQKLALGEAAGNLSLVLRKPGEASNPVVETVSLSDLRYNLYGGARYPAPATVGAYQPARPVVVPVRRAPARPRAAPAPTGRSVEIVRGTQGNEYKVGGNGS